jgi:hypothetical protein
VVKPDNNTITAKGLQGIPHHKKNLKISGGRIAAYYVKIALGEFPVSSPLGIFPAPHFGNVVTLKGKDKIRAVFRHKSGKRNGKIKTEGHIPPPVIGKAVYLFFRFTAALTQKNFSVLKHRRINGDKSKRTERLFYFFYHVPAG